MARKMPWRFFFFENYSCKMKPSKVQWRVCEPSKNALALEGSRLVPGPTHRGLLGITRAYSGYSFILDRGNHWPIKRRASDVLLEITRDFVITIPVQRESC